MKRTYKKWLLTGLFVLFGLSAMACGEKKEQPEETQKVMKISITPSPSPTPKPEYLNQDAIVTNGSITMVNEYTVNKAADLEVSEESDVDEGGEQEIEESDMESQDEES